MFEIPDFMIKGLAKTIDDDEGDLTEEELVFIALTFMSEAHWHGENAKTLHKYTKEKFPELYNRAIEATK